MKKDNIAVILQLQDSVEKKYLKDDSIISERFNFGIDCLNWAFESLNSNAGTNLNMLGLMFTDSLSSILASINVGLWGLKVDSLHLLRPVLELLAIAEYVIKNKKFDEYRQVKKSLNKAKLNFEYLQKKKLIDKELMRVYNNICQQASHATLQRIKNNKFEMDRKIYNRIGCAYNPKEIQLVFGEIVRVSLYLTRVITLLLPEKSNAHLSQKELESRYNKFLK